VARQMDNVDSLVSIHGGSGTNTVTVNDSGTTSRNASYNAWEGDLQRSHVGLAPPAPPRRYRKNAPATQRAGVRARGQIAPEQEAQPGDCRRGR